MGSIAVDPSFHPYGAVVFVDGIYDSQYSFQRLLVASCDGDPRPLSHEQFCSRKANADVSTGYERRLVRESHGRLQWLHY